MRRYAGKEQVILFLLFLIFNCASLSYAKWGQILSMKVPHTSTILHPPRHPSQRGQVTFTALLSEAARSGTREAKSLLISLSAHDESIRNPVDLSTHPNDQPKGGADRKPHSRWMDARRAGSSPCGGVGDCSLYSKTSSRTQPHHDWEQGTLSSLLAKSKRSPQNQYTYFKPSYF